MREEGWRGGSVVPANGDGIVVPVDGVKASASSKEVTANVSAASL